MLELWAPPCSLKMWAHATPPFCDSPIPILFINEWQWPQKQQQQKKGCCKSTFLFLFSLFSFAFLYVWAFLFILIIGASYYNKMLHFVLLNITPPPFVGRYFPSFLQLKSRSFLQPQLSSGMGWGKTELLDSAHTILPCHGLLRHFLEEWEIKTKLCNSFIDTVGTHSEVSYYSVAGCTMSDIAIAWLACSLI